MIEKRIDELIKIINDSAQEIIFLKMLSPDLITKIGFEKWKTLIMYTISNPYLEDLVEIIENKKLDTFFEVYENFETYIEDEKVLGINKFLNIVHFYNYNIKFCEELCEKMKTGYKLTDIEKVNLNVLLYRNTEEKEGELKVENLGKITEDEREEYKKDLEIHNSSCRGNLLRYLFNINLRETEDILQHQMNSKTLIRIINRAKKEKNMSYKIKQNIWEF